MFRLLIPVICIFICFSCNRVRSDTADVSNDSLPQERIISLNGAVSEILVALGHQQELVGRDVTSTFPEVVMDSVLDLGHVSTISIEAVMNLKPTLILGVDNDADRNFLQKIESSGISHKFFHREFSAEGTKELVRNIADITGNSAYQPLFEAIDKDLEQIQVFEYKPKILFIYARGAGNLMVAGSDTPFEKIISMAGGENAISGFPGFKPLTPEALLNHNPDVLLLFDTGMKSIGGVEGLLKIPGVSQTKAGKNKAFIAMDGSLLSGFGPRVGLAAHQLNQLLVPYAK